MTTDKMTPPVSTSLKKPVSNIQESPTTTPALEIRSVDPAMIDESDHFRLRKPPYPGVPVLAQEIREKGQSTPLFIRPSGDRCELISGYRRLAALRFINAPVALCRVYRGISDEAAYDLAISENQDRASLTDLERAEICMRLKKEGKTVEQIATRMGWSGERTVYNHLRVAKEASSNLRAALQTQRLDFKVALVFVEMKTAQLGESVERELLETVIENDLSSRDSKRHIARVTKSSLPDQGEPKDKANPSYVKEFGGGGFAIAARIDPRDPSALDKALAALEAATKRAREIKKRLAQTR